MEKSNGASWKSAVPNSNRYPNTSDFKLGLNRELLQIKPAAKLYKSGNQFFSAANLPSHTASPSTKSNQLQALASEKNEKPLQSKKLPFANIKEKSTKFYKVLRDSQVNIKKAISTDRRRINSNRELKLALDNHKLWRDEPKNIASKNSREEEGIRAYNEIKNHLKREDSALEKLLPEDSSLRRDLFPISGGLRDPKIGLYAELRELSADKTGEKHYVLCFIGTGKGAAIRAQMGTNLNQFMGIGGVPEAHKKALQLTTELRNAIEKQGGKLSLTGHSLGGGICNYVGTKLNIESVCFNAAALGGACHDDLITSGSIKEENINKQTHIRIKGDPVSSPRAQKIMTFFLNMATKMNIKLPQFVGQIYEAKKSDFKHSAPSGMASHQLKTFESLYEINHSNS